MLRGKKGGLVGLALLGWGIVLLGIPAGAQLTTSQQQLGADNLAPSPVAQVMVEVDPQAMSAAVSWPLSADDYIRQQPVGIDFTSGGVFVSVNDVAGYKVWRQAGTAAAELLAALPAGATSFVDPSLQTGVTYVYLVSVVDPAGNESSAVASTAVGGLEMKGLAVVPADTTVPLGVPVQYRSIGVYFGNPDSVVTGRTVWSVSDTSIAMIDAAGLVSTKAEGLVYVRGAVRDLTPTRDTVLVDSTTLTVVPPQVLSLEIAPDDTTIAKGLTAQYRALAEFTNTSGNKIPVAPGSLTWVSLDEAVATINASGVATGVLTADVDSAETRIVGSIGAVTDTTTRLNVIKKFAVNMAIEPTDTTMVAGTAVRLRAIVTFNNGDQEDRAAHERMTWVSRNPGVATADTAGVAAVDSGSTVVVGTYRSIRDSVHQDSMQVLVRPLGDVSNDGLVAVNDAVKVVDFILARQVPTHYESVAADCKPDMWINIVDVVCIVNKILGRPIGGELAAKLAVLPGANQLFLQVAGAEGQLAVRNQTDIAGLQLEIDNLPVGVDELIVETMERSRGMEVLACTEGGRGRVLLFSLRGQTVRPGEGPVFRIKGLRQAETLPQVAEVIAATATGGEFEFEKKASVVVSLDYALSQNFPNPFNAGTVIFYQLPESGHVTIDVFNSLGQRVRRLVEGDQESGYYQVTWNGVDDSGRAVGNGLYFYRIQAGQFSTIKRMLLLK